MANAAECIWFPLALPADSFCVSHLSIGWNGSILADLISFASWRLPPHGPKRGTTVKGKKSLKSRSKPVGLGGVDLQSISKVKAGNQQLEFLAWPVEVALRLPTAKCPCQKTWVVISSRVRPQFGRRSNKVIEKQLVSAHSRTRLSRTFALLTCHPSSAWSSQ